MGKRLHQEFVDERLLAAAAQLDTGPFLQFTLDDFGVVQFQRSYGWITDIDGDNTYFQPWMIRRWVITRDGYQLEADRSEKFSRGDVVTFSYKDTEKGQRAIEVVRWDVPQFRALIESKQAA